MNCVKTFEITLTEPQKDGNGVYQIGTAEELYWFAACVNGTDGVTQNKSANAVLTADITVNTGDVAGYNGTKATGWKDWTPIGNYDNHYTGTFDGKNHTISGLYFNNTSTDYVGLFGFVGILEWSNGDYDTVDGVIKNVGVINSYFNANGNVGGVCGELEAGTIEKSYYTGNVNGTGWYVGGVCGYIYNGGTITSCYNTGTVKVTGESGAVGGVCGINYGTITDCYNTGTVSGFEYVGGVCGDNEEGTITNCYNMGNVSGSSSVGGVCGLNKSLIANCYNIIGTVSATGNVGVVGGVCGRNYEGSITNCYNIGTVSATGRSSVVGGVCGSGSSEGTITSCYNTGTVTATGDNAYVGGVCGENYGTITSCYNTGTVSGNNSVGGVCGSNNATITKCYYLNTTAEKGIGSTESDTEGQAESKTAAEFSAGTVCGLVGYHSQFENGFCALCSDYEPATLTTDKYDIDGDTTKDTVYEIGNAGQLYWFADKVNNENGTYGSANAVLTADITVNDGVLKPDGTLNSGSFTSWTPIGWLDNSDFAEYLYTGTFDGQNHTISGLYFNEPINAEYVGLFGYVFNGKISNFGVVDSYFNGWHDVGGVCGRVSNSTITNCYNTGAVSGTGQNVGGVFGYGHIVTITNCYNTGLVIGTGSDVGSVCGYNEDGTITNCYFLSGTASTGIGAGSGTSDKVEGKTTDEFNNGEVAYLLSQGCTIGEGESALTYDGSIWGQTINTDNYPVLGGKKVLANSDKTKFANDIIINGQNVVLDGTIGFNIYVAADDAYEWSAKIDGAEVTKPAKDENGIYKFTCNVAAKDMAKNIEFYINDDVKATVSVSDYLTELKNTEGEDTPLANLVTAMKTYGTAADKFFNGGNVDPVDSVTADNLSAYTFTKNDAPEGISYYGSSLILKSETTVRHYFQLEEGKNIENFKFYVYDADEPVTPVEKQGYYYIDITNISADKLDTAHTVKINETTVISNYCALSYAKTVLSSGTADNNLKNLVKTLYLYNQKAYSYSTTGGGN